MLLALVAVACALIASTVEDTADWEVDAYPAIHALAGGHIGEYLSGEPMMGPLATLIQAPAVALSGGSGLTAYRWAAFTCLLSAGLVGLYLASIAGRRGATRLTRAILAIVCLVNPLTFEALRNGHPEELLTAALAVAAIASAAEGRRRQTAILLGLAIASKQWAVIAVLPALLVLPSGRIRAGLAAAAVAALLMLPGMAAAPGSFFEVQGEASRTGRVVTPWSVWYPISSSTKEVYEVGGQTLVADRREPPSGAGSLSHPLIVALAVALPIGLALRRGWLPLSGAEAMALLALLALIRCALDPVDNLYYHLPLLLAVVGWDALSSRGAPLRSLGGIAASLWFWNSWHDLSDPATFNAIYLAATAVVAAALTSSVFGRSTWTCVPRIRIFAGLSPNSGD